jgi:hypothetical protein
MNATIKQQVFQIFNKADSSALSFAESLLALGVGDRATARPLALEWASAKFNVRIVDGQRGKALDGKAANYEAAKTASRRVLQVCFPQADMNFAAKRNETDPVERLVKMYAKLSGAQKRSFKAAI